MVTTVTETIGGTSPDRTTIALWESNTQGNLVTDDEIQEGRCRAVTLNATVTIAGSTTSTTQYRHLTADPVTNAEHDGTEGSGVYIVPSTTGKAITVEENHFHLSLLEIGAGTDPSDEAVRVGDGAIDNITTHIDQCLFHGNEVDQSDGVYIGNNGDGIVVNITNCFFWSWGRAGVHRQSTGNGSFAATMNVDNCTIVGTSVNTNAAGGMLAYTSQPGASATFNANGCIVSHGTATSPILQQSFQNYDTGQAGTHTWNVTDCIVDDDDITSAISEKSGTQLRCTEDATFQTGTSYTAGDVVMFVDYAGTVWDLHLEDDANNVAIDYIDGTTPGPYTLDDIDGTGTRTAATDTSAGADEIAAGGGGGGIEVLRRRAEGY